MHEIFLQVDLDTEPFFYKNPELNGKRLKVCIISNELAKIYEVVQNYAIQNMLGTEDQQSKKNIKAI